MGEAVRQVDYSMLAPARGKKFSHAFGTDAAGAGEKLRQEFDAYVEGLTTAGLIGVTSLLAAGMEYLGPGHPLREAAKAAGWR